MDQVQSEQPNVPVEAEPRYVHQTASLPVAKTEHGQTWLRTLAVILAALVLIVIIVFFARWLYHKTHHKTQPAPATSQQTPAKSSQKSTSKAKPGTSSSPTASQPSTNSPNPAPSSNSQITNTGPGSVAAIFVGTSLAAAGLHYIVSLRRQTHEN